MAAADACVRVALADRVLVWLTASVAEADACVSAALAETLLACVADTDPVAVIVLN